MMGKVGKDLGCHVVRCSENHFNGEDKGTMKVLHDIVDTKSDADLSNSLPCDQWSQWQTLNIHQHGQSCADGLKARRCKSRLLIRKFCKLARAVARRGGRVTFEWPRFCVGWSYQELQKLIRDQKHDGSGWVSSGIDGFQRGPAFEEVAADHYGQPYSQNI